VRFGTETVAGRDSSHVEVSAPGTGDTLAPSGSGVPTEPHGKDLRPTRRVVYTILRRSDTLLLVWHAPEPDAEALTTSIRDTLKTLTMRGDPVATQSY
jgi:hypothetical protein